MKGLRLVLALAGLAALSACAKGSSGAAGDPGPTGTPGTLAQAPRIDFLSVPALTHNTIATVYGANLAAVVSSNGAASVFVNGHVADVVSGDATSITFTHAIEDDSSLWDTDGVLTVVVNNLASNSLPIYLAQPGLNLALSETFFGAAGAIGRGASNSLLVYDLFTGAIDRVSSAGDVTQLVGSLNGSTKLWEIGANIWELDQSGALGKYDTATGAYVKVAQFSGVVDADVDAAANVYILHGNDTIDKWDGTSHVTTVAFATANNAAASFNPGAMSFMGGSLFITDLSNAAVIAVSLADQMSTVYVANAGLTLPIKGLANDGTNLFVYANGNLAQVDNAGVVTPLYSTLHPDTNPNFQRQIVTDATGKVFVTAFEPNFGIRWIARYSAAGATLEPWAALSVSGGFANIGMRIFDGSMIPVSSGSPDVTTGILYESMPDGSLRRVTSSLRNGDVFTELNNYPATLKVHGGKLWALDTNTGNIGSINPDTGVVTLFYDNVTNAGIDTPTSIDFDAAGNAYVGNTDPISGNFGIAKFAAAGTLVDSGWAFSPFLDRASALAVQGTRLVAYDDCDYCEFWSVPLSATPGTFGTYIGDGAANGNGAFYVQTRQMNTNAAGNIEFVDDYSSNQFRTLSSANEVATPITSANNMIYGQLDPSGIVIGMSNNYTHIVVLP